MKKIISVILASLMIVSAIPLTALADTLKSVDGDWEYSVIYEEKGVQYGEITKYIGTERELIIPNGIDGCKIVGINAVSNSSRFPAQSITVSEGIEYISGSAFKTSKFSISLPSTLKFIDEKVFSQTELTAINFPEGLQAISENAFSGSVFVNKDIVLPQSLLYLEHGAFNNSNIESVSIGSKVQFCGAYYTWPAQITEYDTVEDKEHRNPFFQCNNLIDITLDSKNPYLQMSNGMLFSDDMRILVKICNNITDVVIPDSVEYICDNFFKNRKLGNVYLGRSLKEINTFMFDSSKIDKLEFSPNSEIKKISNGAFSRAKINEPLIIPRSVREIEESAFKNADIPSLSFESNSALQKIKYEAFAYSNIPVIDLTNCNHLYYLHEKSFSNSAISEIDMSQTYVNEIYPNVFENCSNLENVVLSKCIETLWNDAFYNCKSLKSINQGSAKSEFGDPFNGCNKEQIINTNKCDIVQYGTSGDFSYTEYDLSVKINKYTGKGSDVVIPDEINGKPVTEIGSLALYGKKYIDSVVLPKHLEKIDEQAFAWSTISEISKLPESVWFIGRDAFIGNDFIDFELNDGVEYIGEYAIKDCKVNYIPDSVRFLGLGSLEATAIKEISFGAGLIDIDDIVYDMIYGEDIKGDIILERIDVNNGNLFYSSEEGVLYNYDKTELIRYPVAKTNSSFEIPESVCKIKSYAFTDCKYLYNLTITKNVAEIEDYALEKCASFKKVVFKDNDKLKSLFETFNGCKNLEKVEFGKNMAIRKMKSTFRNSGIKETEIPSSVRLLLHTFHNSPLEKIRINNGVEVIGVSAFRNTNIEKISLPTSVQSVARLAFADCSKLSEVDLGCARTLGTLAFKNCVSLNSIDLTGVRYDNTENQNSFLGCSNLTKLYFTKDGIAESIEEDANENNETIKTVVIGGDIVKIKSRAFANCKNLTSALISDGVNDIDDTAFDGCDKLTIVCTEDSYAAKYAQRNDIKYTTLSVDSIPDQQYTGKALTPDVTVRFGNNRLSKGSDFEAQYSDNIKIGSAKVIVVGKGDYSIYAALARFNIIHTVHKYDTSVVKPTYTKQGYTVHTCRYCGKNYITDYTPKLEVDKTSISKLTAKKKAFYVQWNKVKAATGYQIQYSTTKSFKTKKTITVKGVKNVAKTIKKLKSKKKYYVRVRAYKTYKGKKYYSKWSKIKNIKTKK